MFINLLCMQCAAEKYTPTCTLIGVEAPVTSSSCLFGQHNSRLPKAPSTRHFTYVSFKTKRKQNHYQVFQHCCMCPSAFENYPGRFVPNTQWKLVASVDTFGFIVHLLLRGMTQLRKENDAIAKKVNPFQEDIWLIITEIFSLIWIIKFLLYIFIFDIWLYGASHPGFVNQQEHS